jgi:hypothetical protein
LIILSIRHGYKNYDQVGLSQDPIPQPLPDLSWIKTTNMSYYIRPSGKYIKIRAESWGAKELGLFRGIQSRSR